MHLPVSVIVSAYNAEAPLEATLSSISRQTMRDFECIIVDDCSTDGTRAVAERFRRDDPRFRLVAHRAHGGSSETLNSGLRAALGEHVTTLEAGDLLTPASLELRYPPAFPVADADHLDGAIYFFPHSGYHVWTIDLAAPALRAANLPFAVVDLSVQRGDDRGLRQKLAETGLPSISYSRFVLERHRPGMVVVFNDWDHVTRPIIAAARVAGIPNAAIVEGIQDYNDVDTGRVRQPYKMSNTILLPGAFDRRYFADGGRQRLHDVGIPRVKHLRQQQSPLPSSEKPIALVNSNFSYNVLTEHRDAWVRSAVAAVRAAGLEPVISRHPGDLGVEHSELVTTDDFYTALSKSTVTVQRFASGVLEALATGRGVVYFNPHREKVDKFRDPLGAYRRADTEEDLRAALTGWRQLLAMSAEHGPAFLDLHSGPLGASTEDAIVEALGAERIAAPSEPAIEQFHRLLGDVDQATEALTSGKQLFLEIDDTGIEREFARLRESNEVRAAAVARGGRRSFRPIWFVRTSTDGALRRLYQREKERNSLLFKWAQPIARLYRKLIAPY